MTLLFFTYNPQSLTPAFFFFCLMQMPKVRPTKPAASGNPYGSPPGKGKGNGDNASSPPIKPSPFKKSNKKKAAEPPKIRIKHVVPIVDPDNAENTGHEGFTVIIDGWLQSKVTSCVYKKNIDPMAQMMFDAIDPVSHVFEYEDGDTPMMKQGNNGTWYPVEILVHYLDGEEVVDRETLEGFVLDTLVPALMQQKKVNVRPEMHPTEGYERLTSWNRILGNTSGLMALYQFNFKQSSDENFGSWIKAHKTNLYSLYPIGGVPEHIKKQFVLTNEHLFPADHVQAPVGPADGDVNGNAGGADHVDGGDISDDDQA